MNRRLLLLGGFAVVSAAACSEKRANLTDPVGASAYGYQMQQTATNLPRGTVRYKFHATPAAVTPDSFVVTLQGIDSLGTSGFYTAWAGDSLGTTFKRITGVLEAQRTDTTLDAVGNILPAPQPKVTVGTASAIQNGSARTTYTWRFERTNAGLLATDSMVVFLISIEESSTAATPGSRRPLFARRSEGSPAAGAASSTLRFGNYAGNPLEQYLYVATPARGRGVVWGNIIEVDDSTMARPPLGYYYAVYAFKDVPPGSTAGDTLFVGELTSPYPRRNLSLYNADSVRTDPLVVLDNPRSILTGSARISADTVAKLPKGVACTGYAAGVNFECPYKGYSQIRLTLESKNGIRGRMSPNRVLGSAFPFVVTAGQR
jgi:hypothetical protein